MPPSRSGVRSEDKTRRQGVRLNPRPRLMHQIAESVQRNKLAVGEEVAERL